MNTSPANQEKKIGKIKFFSETKAYGFIIPDEGGKDVFFHVKGVPNGKANPPKQEEKVSYKIIDGQRGPEAIEVRRV